MAVLVFTLSAVVSCNLALKMSPVIVLIFVVCSMIFFIGENKKQKKKKKKEKKKKESISKEINQSTQPGESLGTF